MYINTKRLHIRKFMEEDWREQQEYLSDPEVVRYEPYNPMDEAACKEMSAFMVSSADFWAVCLAEGKLIGQVYLAEQEQRTWEAGYVFNRHYQNRGYATEAVAALMNHVFAECNAHRITADCNPENIRSWKLLERLHFRREGCLIKNIYFNTDESGEPLWQDTYIYSILREEWEKYGDD